MDNQLVGAEIHGFHTMQDLDVATIMEEAKARWLRPNEIHAVLYNYKYFSINVKPVNLPKSGTIVLFDRKMLRNFRKDGHNWKKKKDGKTVKEAHEHLKVGNEERIHVYYAHGEDSPTFVRRCYWLLDKSLEHIVLVHYRETQELQASPVTPGNSNNSSSVSDPSWLLAEELDSGANNAYYAGQSELSEPGDRLTVKSHEQRLHDINTLEWEELLVTNDSKGGGSGVPEKVTCYDQQSQVVGNGSISGGASSLSPEISSFDNLSNPTVRSDNVHFSLPESPYVPTVGGSVNSNAQIRDSIAKGTSDSLDILANNGLHSQDSFGRWINQIMTESPGSVDNPVLESTFSDAQESFASPAMNHLQSSVSQQIFNITDVSPSWGFSNEKTKILITGFFHQEYLHLSKSDLLCICGDVCLPAELVQVGVYRCFVPPHLPRLVNLFMSIDGHKPISLVLNFEYRAPVLSDPVVSSEENKWEEFQVQMRLAYLIFSPSKCLDIISSKVTPNALKEAKKFSHRTSHISNSWGHLMKAVEDNKTPLELAKDSLFELILRNRLKDWLLERVVDSSKKPKHYDTHGQGVIHLCAILEYTWAVRLFSWSGLSLDFRDRRGWTALHWAAYCGREKMVGVLLSAGAKPNLVTDPTSENPGGCTAADLAYMKGYDGLAAYLSEKALVEQFKDMKVAGNVSGSLQTSSNYIVNSENISEDEINLKDTLAAYQTAADAAARIQAAYRENSLKQKTDAVQYSVPEAEARGIIAALKIQHAFRNYDTRKKISAAGRIQYRFRTWKLRQEFLSLRRQTIKIQAAFRGFQVRRQYRKVLWSVGVLEKAVLRWRLKRRGLRGLNRNVVPAEDEEQESVTEEDFFRASRKQAEDRVERSVVRVQAMFRSQKAQQEYRRMKLTHDQAKLEFQDLDPDTSMDS